MKSMVKVRYRTGRIARLHRQYAENMQTLGLVNILEPVQLPEVKSARRRQRKSKVAVSL